MESSQLARDHSRLLGERLTGFLSSVNSQGPTSFAGLGLGQPTRVNEYASLAGPGDEDGSRHLPLARYVSSINRVLPSGVQLEPTDVILPVVPRTTQPAAQTQQAAQAEGEQQAQAHQKLNGWLDVHAGRAAQPQQQQQQEKQQQEKQRQQAMKQSMREASPAPPQQAQVTAIPGKPLKLRFKIPRASSEPRTWAPAGSQQEQQQQAGAAATASRPDQQQQQLLQAARQLGRDPLLSPIPASWAEALELPDASPEPAQHAQHAQQHEATPAPEQQHLLQQQQQQQGSPPAAIVVQSAGDKVPSPFAPLSGGGFAAEDAKASQPLPPLQPHQQPQLPSHQQGFAVGPVQQPPPSLPPTAGGGSAQQGTKRPASPRAAVQAVQAVHAVQAAAAVVPSAQQAPAAAQQHPPAAAWSPQPKRRRPEAAAGGSASPSAQQAQQHAQQHAQQPTDKRTEAGRSRTPPLPVAPLTAGAPGARNTAARTAASPAPASPASALQIPANQLPFTQPPSAHQPILNTVQPPVHHVQPPATSPSPAATALYAPSDGGLAAVAALLPSVFEAAASGSAAPLSSAVQQLQKEGKKLKTFAEKRMKDGKPTHISSMFLCQSCVKFLEAAAVMEAHPAKFSRESTSSMYSQTASLLDSCVHNASRADGPAPITAALSLLAQRLAAVARLRAAFCLRVEGSAQAAAFKAALEKGSGETYQRPSPTDSNTSTSISLPLEAGGKGGARLGGSGGGGGTTPAAVLGLAGKPATPPAPAGPATAAASEGGNSAGSSATVLLVGMPKPLLERQLMAAQHSTLVFQALSSFGKSGEKLREYMGQAVAQNSVHGLKAAAAALLLSADAGMGPASTVLGMAKEALDAVMAMQ